MKLNLINRSFWRGMFLTTANLIFAVTGFAQEKTEFELPKQCTAELARSLVVQQVADSKTVEATDKQIKILLRTADFLWQSDEPTARKYFADALDQARIRFKEKGTEEKRERMFTSERADYRFQVLTAIAKHDAKWAQKLTEDVLREAEEKDKAAAGADDADKLLGTARDLLEANPAAAFQFARRAARVPLRGSGAMSWHSFLYAAAEKNQSEADAVYAELLAAGGEAARILDLRFLSGYPFGKAEVFGVGNSNIGANVPANFQPNAALQRQFLLVLLRRTAELQPVSASAVEESWQLSEAATAVSLWQDLELIVTERHADLMPRIAAAKTYANSLMTPENAAAMNRERENETALRAPFDEKLAKLEKNADAERQDYLIVDLVFAAKTEAEFDKAEDWLVKISEDTVRDSTVNFLFFKRAELAVKENRLTDAERWTEKVGELEHRAILYFKIAEARLKGENDKARAIEVLETVVKAALKAPNGVERAQVLLGTAFRFAEYNEFRTGEVLSEAVKTANRLENPDLSATFVYRKIQGKNFGYFSGFATPGYNLEKSFAAIAVVDFQTALVQARNLDDKYLRTLGVIAVVGDCAAQKSEPQKKVPPRKTSKSKPAAKI